MYLLEYLFLENLDGCAAGSLGVILPLGSDLGF
jgi:hypothetical protein